MYNFEIVYSANIFNLSLKSDNTSAINVKQSYMINGIHLFIYVNYRYIAVAKRQ